MDSFLTAMVTVATAIIGVALLAVFLSKNSQTPAVIQAFTGGLGQDLQAATAPITGGAGLSFTSGFGGLGTSAMGG